MTAKNFLYAQSGGVTPVINASAAGIMHTARQYPELGAVYAARNGIIGVLREELFDTTSMLDEQVMALRHTPGGTFGSCRYKLKGVAESRAEYERLIEVFKAHDIGIFFYNGGGDSADTAFKISQMGTQLGFPIQCIGVPKTIDNDLPITDVCPGFPTVAKYVAIATMEASLDVMSMSASSTKVFILEVMGRHAGWIAAAAGLAQRQSGDAPQLILFPEISFDQPAFLQRVQRSVTEHGYCTVVVSEGVRDDTGKFLSDSGVRDAFGHAQLGGVAPRIAALIKGELGHKCHWAVADYLQRSARHIASRVDVEQAWAVGRAAVEFAAAGESGVMPVIERVSSKPYQWRIAKAQLSAMANQEKLMPRTFIDASGFAITQACRDYLAPLIAGEDYPPYRDDGLPDYLRPGQCPLLPQKLAKWTKTE